MSQNASATGLELVAEQIDERPQRKSATELGHGDESALSWYFGQGLSIYDRSTFGDVLQRIILDGYHSRTCEKCDGAGILEDGGFAMATKCTKCNGVGKFGDPPQRCRECNNGTVEPYEVEAEHGGWCTSCRGTGTGSVAKREVKRPDCSACGGGVRAKKHCAHCCGGGHEPISAAPMGGPEEGAGAMPDDSALTRFAITGRRLAQVKARSPALASALECYFGDVGSRWGREDCGRIFALYALTASGKRLARWGTPTNPKTKPGGKKARKAALAARWRNPAVFPSSDPFAELEARAIASERRTRVRIERELAESLNVARQDFIGPIRRRRLPRWKPRKLVCWLSNEHPSLRRKAEAGPARADQQTYSELTDQQKIWSQVVAQREQPKRERQVLLEAANKQAKELLERACAAWLAAEAPRKDLALQRLAAHATKAGMVNLATHIAAHGAGR